tara:strand:+ start:855 stop:1184 length:330 start_codon:yes stop_codon:yes gene_type:complete
MSGKYLYFNIGSGDGAANDFAIFPVDKLMGFDTVSGGVNMLFEASTGATSADVVLLTVADSADADNRRPVIKAIAEAIINMNAGLLTVCDSDNSEFLHENITDCTITLQ